MASTVTTRVFAAEPTTAIVVTVPGQGQSILDTNVQILGTSPNGVLVQVVIADTDTNQPFIEHQQYGKVDGSVTSDQNGHWAFTPQQTLVPGQFSVKASYANAQGQTVTSSEVKFVVIDANGSSQQLSMATIREIILAGVVSVLLLILVIYLIHHHRKRQRGTLYDTEPEPHNQTEEPEQHKEVAPAEHEVNDDTKPLFMGTAAGRNYQNQQDVKLKVYEEETRRIEAELAKTAEELKHANAQVIALRRGFGNKK